MQRVDTPQLAALAAVVDEGSFEGAADVLRLTQPAVSQRIKALETAVGQVLVRRTRPVTVTDAGRAYLRLARQVAILTDDARRTAAGGTSHGPVSLPIAVNSDSLGSWVLPALAPLASDIAFDLRREDEDHSAALLRDGTVMAAITTSSTPVQGCTVTRLGVLTYRAMAQRASAARWFPDGATAAALGAAPVVVFDLKDDLQDEYLRSRGVTDRPPRHHVPATADFAQAVRLGMGWGLLPEADAVLGERDGVLTDLDPGHRTSVTLYWQQWSLPTSALERTAAAISQAAAASLG